jgi:hypothetical protein
MLNVLRIVLSVEVLAQASIQFLLYRARAESHVLGSDLWLFGVPMLIGGIVYYVTMGKSLSSGMRRLGATIALSFLGIFCGMLVGLNMYGS